jgi:DNA-binding CsgD family transcriptional regulator
MAIGGTRTEGGSVPFAARTMRATRGRAHQFWRVFDKSLVPMVTVDNDRRYLAANRAARLLFRLSLAEMRQRQIYDFTPPEMQDTLEDSWERLMRIGAVAGRYTVHFADASRLQIIYCAIANVLPSQHLIVFAPAEWPDDELGMLEDGTLAPLEGPLSPREREVLTLIAAGADFQQIACELTISPSTVRTHVQNAHRKLGARNRAHSIAIAMQRGLIDLPGPPTDGGPPSSF